MPFLNDVPTTSGRMMRELEKAHGWSHSELGRRLGFPVFIVRDGEETCPKVSDIAYGQYRINPQSAMKLESLYEITFGEHKSIPEEEIQEDELERWFQQTVRPTVLSLKEQLENLRSEVKSLREENESLRLRASEPKDRLSRLWDSTVGENEAAT